MIRRSQFTAHSSQFTARSSDAIAAFVFQAAVLLYILLASPSAREPRALSVSDIFPAFFPTAFALYLFINRIRQSQLKLDTDIRLFAKRILLGAVAGLLVTPFARLLTQLTHVLIVGLGFAPPLPQWLVESFAHPDTANAAKIAVAFSAIVCAPVAEEILNRWAIAGALAKRIHPALAAILSALWFSALHMNVLSAPGLFVLGIVFAALYHRTASIVAPVTAHAVFNMAFFIGSQA